MQRVRKDFKQDGDRQAKIRATLEGYVCLCVLRIKQDERGRLSGG